MNFFPFLIALILVFVGLAGCAADDGHGSGISSSVAALTAEESAALDACVAEVKACRLGDDPGSDACREIYTCLPDRPESDRKVDGDWRVFCDGIDERCLEGDPGEMLCEDLRERCLGARLVRGECIDECEASGMDGESCKERCVGADTDRRIIDEQDGTPITLEECMEGCEAAGAPADACTERCGTL
jgi:hypothetical protein